MANIYPYQNQWPAISEQSFVADHVVITGNVSIAEDANIWFNTVIRGDVSPTIIEKKVNIQDQCTLHQSPNLPLHLEEGVSVGHQCLLHSCTVKKNALIGMGSIVLDGAEIGEGALIGAGSLIPKGKKIPPKTLAFGRPAKVIRDLNEADLDEMKRIREQYVMRGKEYKETMKQQSHK
ncbi:gamma carbonic anhydrase family protein [Texcoconibacillus texcoconensis]|uniref:Carbonic anhydrase/acetyltransferase-like protein (Isoleucine patch superfamily) n=1 Tax=Texcoconibacillus texcoconensis TaxID=1095777 RepID=A0A840QN98_9BACI|nr:gamma carbonic anhydrase family protein [Texcoconibacillus texcoconensis]MBB5172820.1 carbonic anhydrase/acetyltransferase-like protein (isoleucine patch superfamily) [Texcoconibacillus texcoconensis]